MGCFKAPRFIFMEPKTVPCDWCLDWEESKRYNTMCPRCGGTKQVINPKTVLCNLCGETSRPLGTHNEQYPQGLEDVSVVGGYDSSHLSDMIRYRFTFCEKCLRALFNQCKIPPAVFEVSFSDVQKDVPYDYAKDRESYEYNSWYHNGGWHDAYMNKRCNFVKDCQNKAVYSIFEHDKFTESCCCEEHKHLREYKYNKFVKFIPHILKPFL